MYIIGLLNKDYMANDAFLFSCAELMFDLLGEGRWYKASWISREHNGVCDGLARDAVTSQSPVVVCGPGFEGHQEDW